MASRSNGYILNCQEGARARRRSLTFLRIETGFKVFLSLFSLPPLSTAKRGWSLRGRVSFPQSPARKWVPFLDLSTRRADRSTLPTSSPKAYSPWLKSASEFRDYSLSSLWLATPQSERSNNQAHLTLSGSSVFFFFLRIILTVDNTRVHFRFYSNLRALMISGFLRKYRWNFERYH